MWWKSWKLHCGYHINWIYISDLEMIRIKPWVLVITHKNVCPVMNGNCHCGLDSNSFHNHRYYYYRAIWTSLILKFSKATFRFIEMCILLSWRISRISDWFVGVVWIFPLLMLRTKIDQSSLAYAHLALLRIHKHFKLSDND